VLEVQNDFWHEAGTGAYDAVCCTTNRIIKSNGELVMGAGIAKLFKEKYPSLPREWGQRIKTGDHMQGVMLTRKDKDDLYLVAFPTKHDWKKPSRMEIIEFSAKALRWQARLLNWKKVLLPRPGCSNGGLDWDKEVKPVLENILKEDRFVIIRK
jgi:hypothetical protein